MAPSQRAHARGFWSRLILNNARFLAVELRKIAEQLEAAAPGPPAVALILFHHQGVIAVSDIQVPDDSGPLTATATYLDAKGNPTSPGAVPAWTSSDESVATVSSSDDGLTATVTLTGKTGATQVTATDTESEGAEDDVISVGTVSVVSGKAVVGSIEFSA
jgi:hypothetical protein